MPFSKLGVFRHRNCLDIDILVLAVQYHGAEYSKLRVSYYYRNGQPLGLTETVTVNKGQYPDWSKVG